MTRNAIESYSGTAEEWYDIHVGVCVAAVLSHREQNLLHSPSHGVLFAAAVRMLLLLELQLDCYLSALRAQ